MAGSFDYNPAGLQLLMTDTTGGIARQLSAQAERVVVAAQSYVGTQWPGGPSSPPQPFRRTGDLQTSIRATPPHVVGGTLVVKVVADAAHSGVVYPFVLRERGFQFVDLESLRSFR